MILTGSISDMLKGQYKNELVIIVAGSGIPRKRYQHLLDEGCDIRHMARFAPSRDTLKQYKEDGDEEAYTVNFIKDMQKKDRINELSHLINESDKDVRLVCHEPEDGSFCHRHILKGLVGETKEEKNMICNECNNNEVPVRRGRKADPILIGSRSYHRDNICDECWDKIVAYNSYKICPICMGKFKATRQNKKFCPNCDKHYPTKEAKKLAARSLRLSVGEHMPYITESDAGGYGDVFDEASGKFVSGDNEYDSFNDNKTIEAYDAPEGDFLQISSDSQVGKPTHTYNGEGKVRTIGPKDPMQLVRNEDGSIKTKKLRNGETDVVGYKTYYTKIAKEHFPRTNNKAIESFDEFERKPYNINQLIKECNVQVVAFEEVDRGDDFEIITPWDIWEKRQVLDNIIPDKESVNEKVRRLSDDDLKLISLKLKNNKGSVLGIKWNHKRAVIDEIERRAQEPAQKLGRTPRLFGDWIRILLPEYDPLNGITSTELRARYAYYFKKYMEPVLSIKDRHQKAHEFQAKWMLTINEQRELEVGPLDVTYSRYDKATGVDKLRNINPRVYNIQAKTHDGEPGYFQKRRNLKYWIKPTMTIDVPKGSKLFSGSVVGKIYAKPKRLEHESKVEYKIRKLQDIKTVGIPRGTPRTSYPSCYVDVDCEFKVQIGRSPYWIKERDCDVIIDKSIYRRYDVLYEVGDSNIITRYHKYPGAIPHKGDVYRNPKDGYEYIGFNQKVYDATQPLSFQGKVAPCFFPKRKITQKNYTWKEKQAMEIELLPQMISYLGRNIIPGWLSFSARQILACNSIPSEFFFIRSRHILK